MGVNFYIENQQITGLGSAKTLEFDITANTLSPNIYLDNAAMRLTYNTTIFGHSIVNDGLVTLTPGTGIRDTMVYMTIAKDYKTQDTLNIGIGTKFSTNQILGSRLLLNSTKQKLLHVAFAFKNSPNCLEQANISFVNFPELSQLVEFYTLTAKAPYDGSAMMPYLANASTNLTSFPLCNDPVIYDFSPHTINAGVGTPFHIDGYNFGTGKAGVLFFKNSDNGGANYVQIDRADITSWTNTSIDLIFPSQCDSGRTDSAGKPIAGLLGSGLFQVFNDDSKYAVSPSSIPFVVNYSVRTRRIPPASGIKNVKLPINLVNKNNTGGYLFVMSAAVKSNAKAVKLIKSAIAKWRCATGVNFQLDTINTSEIGVMADNVNTISFTTFSDSTLGKTTAWSTICDKPYMTNIDIEFKSPLITNWFMEAETAEVPAGQIDFLQVVLHELGHAHNLGHVNEKTELMYYRSGSSKLAPTDRRINIGSTTSTFDGGNYVISYSKGPTCSAVVLPSMKYVSECSYHVGWIEQNTPNGVDMGASFNIFPNPFENIINIEFELSTSADTQISLLNIFGEEISSTKKNQLAEGIHTISFNENIPNGIYLIRLVVNDRWYTKKVIKY